MFLKKIFYNIKEINYKISTRRKKKNSSPTEGCVAVPVSNFRTKSACSKFLVDTGLTHGYVPVSDTRIRVQAA